jgi:4-amino-4-deoxy-L-arabinose transferase-like glycosyltransferase
MHFIKRHWFTCIQFLLGFLAVFAHLYQLDIMPGGLYLDESSIGVNAAGIANNGRDEFGNFLPIYFKAFGEYKNPIYIYLTALIFKSFGVSHFTLRLPSFIFFVLGLLFLYLLISKIFSTSKLIKIYTIIGFGFLPHYFNISRIAFEVISQLTFTTFSLLLIYKLFHEKTHFYADSGKKLIPKIKNWLRQSSVLSALLGLSLGFTIYTYTTARALSFLFLGSIFLIYWQKENIRKFAIILTSFLTSLVPFFIFASLNPNGLTKRFSEISYFYDPNISILFKLGKFTTEYIKYFNPVYLIGIGDTNLRHTIGYGGLVYISIFILFFCGLWYFVKNSFTQSNQFYLLLVVNLFLSVVPAAMTTDSTPHSLRSLLLSLFVFLISCFGLHFLQKIKKKKYLSIAIVLFLCLEVGQYVNYFFNKYPEKSKYAMGSYGLEDALKIAVNQNPNKIIMTDTMWEGKTQLEFAKLVVGDDRVSKAYVSKLNPQKNTCIIFQSDDADKLNKYSLPYKDLSNPNWFVRLRCY